MRNATRKNRQNMEFTICWRGQLSKNAVNLNYSLNSPTNHSSICHISSRCSLLISHKVSYKDQPSNSPSPPNASVLLPPAHFSSAPALTRPHCCIGNPAERRRPSKQSRTRGDGEGIVVILGMVYDWVCHIRSFRCGKYLKIIQLCPLVEELTV